MVDNKEIFSLIVIVLVERFVTHGVRNVRGGRFVRKLSDGNTEQQYHITFRKKYGCFLMSIELIVQNKVLLKDFDVLYRETLIFGYRNFEDNFRDECIKMILKQKYVTLCGLGDWRELKEENESLESFNARFRLWSPPYFEDLKDLNNILEKEGSPTWQEQCLTSINLSLKFFKKTEDINWIINNTEYQGLFLLKQMGRVEEVENKYNSLLEKKRKYGNNTESIEYFYKLLMNKGV